MNTIQIKKSELERLGSNSLIGLASHYGFQPGPLRIEFEEWSYAQTEHNKGPDWVLVPEFLPLCLCQDMLTLTRLGFQVELGKFHVEQE
jgi:hypothetical protein